MIRPIHLFLVGYGLVTISLQGQESHPEAYKSSSSSHYGDSMEWKQLKGLSQHPNIIYDTFLEEDHIKLVMQTADQILVKKILYCGFTIWIDSTVTQKKVRGFTYPIHWTVRKGRSRELNQILNDPITVSELSFLPIGENLMMHNNSGKVRKRGYKLNHITNDYGLVALVNMSENGTLNYQAKIPYSAIGLSRKDVRSIGFEIGELMLPYDMFLLKLAEFKSLFKPLNEATMSQYHSHNNAIRSKVELWEFMVTTDY